jgi:hypothetical protein
MGATAGREGVSLTDGTGDDGDGLGGGTATTQTGFGPLFGRRRGAVREEPEGDTRRQTFEEELLLAQTGHEAQEALAGPEGRSLSLDDALDAWEGLALAGLGLSGGGEGARRTRAEMMGRCRPLADAVSQGLAEEAARERSKGRGKGRR